MNQQPIEKRVRRESGELDVHSIFFTIQGEGPFSGQRAVFVRLAGCDLQCPGCDTDYTSTRKLMSPSELVQSVRLASTVDPKGLLVVITGGEPFRQNLIQAILFLLNAGFRVQIETNGTLFQPLQYDEITVVCSPKAGSINRELLPHVAALKYVISADAVAEDDGLPILALGHSAKPRLARPPAGFSGTIYIQPADALDAETNARNLKAAVRGVFEFGYTLCLQTHKIIGVE